MKITIPDDYQTLAPTLACFAQLQKHEVVVLDKHLSEAELAVQLYDTEALVLIRERTPITASLLARLPNLKVISLTGKVSQHIDVEACSRAGVAVLEGVGSPVAPSELTWALIMAANRHLLPYCMALKAGEWQQNQGLGLGRALQGQVLGIWGFGKIGKRIAEYAQVFGMQVMVWGSEASRQAAQEAGYRAATSKEQFFAESDTLTLHLRLNSVTEGCVTSADLKRMKADAVLVNTSRSALIESGALLAALQAGHPGYAALDVFDEEPLAAEDPLLTLPNVLASPHIGYVEKQGYELYLRTAFENLVRYIEGDSAVISNAAVLKHPRQQQ